MAGIEKAYLEPEKGSKIPCMFNPTELVISKSTKWNQPKVARKDAPDQEYQQGESGKLTIKLTLDTTDSGKSVTTHTDNLMNLMKATVPDQKAKVDRPPWVRFRWGRTHSFKSIVQSVDITFNYFASDGTPLRASLTLTLVQFEDEGKWPLQNPTSGTPELHTLHTVKSGETLDRISYQHYGDPALWRNIARVNQIIDPLDLTTGSMLRIPDQEAVSNAG